MTAPATDPCATVVFRPSDDPAYTGTLTITTPEQEGGATISDWAPGTAVTTFGPASRATLEAMRATIDRALAAPRVVQRCDGVFGGSPILLALSWTGEA